VDVLTRHRLSLLGVDPDEIDRLDLPARIEAVHRAFVTRIPFETISRLRRWREHPAEPGAWLRTTDRLLREHATDGAGGTSFSLSYALADLLRGVGVVAHTTLAHHLRRDEPHAAVLVFTDEGGFLHDPTYFLPMGVPVRPGGSASDGLFAHSLEPRRGPTLVLVQRGPGGEVVPLYALVAVPAGPDEYRRAWTDDCRRHRESHVRMARRDGDVVQRWSERHGCVEVTTPEGRRDEDLGPDVPGELHRRFGLSESLLRSQLTPASQAG
jgi:hypothetical protein